MTECRPPGDAPGLYWVQYRDNAPDVIKYDGVLWDGIGAAWKCTPAQLSGWRILGPAISPEKAEGDIAG